MNAKNSETRLEHSTRGPGYFFRFRLSFFNTGLHFLAKDIAQYVKLCLRARK